MDKVFLFNNVPNRPDDIVIQIKQNPDHIDK